ncbi:Tubulin-tyrosine ligase family protein [Besnoitia besnoiti]|uniref:Tubulin-tyrosine ligase family protein n=1 Tax=Besnoitia besnoiti TaxID=94643 RepID=A0A2A9MLH8_BESBE|nr:Tubulin-tyrosine ligase family protein [Besnoitia besnoiti]PFH36312.1 Tubulin-tyrosine ligase family protein [Besnoitia besnoiti]
MGDAARGRRGSSGLGQSSLVGDLAGSSAGSSAGLPAFSASPPPGRRTPPLQRPRSLPAAETFCGGPFQPPPDAFRVACAGGLTSHGSAASRRKPPRYSARPSAQGPWSSAFSFADTPQAPPGAFQAEGCSSSKARGNDIAEGGFFMASVKPSSSSASSQCVSPLRRAEEVAAFGSTGASVRIGSQPSLCLRRDSPDKEEARRPVVQFAVPPAERQSSLALRRNRSRCVIQLNQIEFSKVALGIIPVDSIGKRPPQQASNAGASYSFTDSTSPLPDSLSRVHVPSSSDLHLGEPRWVAGRRRRVSRGDSPAVACRSGRRSDTSPSPEAMEESCERETRTLAHPESLAFSLRRHFGALPEKGRVGACPAQTPRASLGSANAHGSHSAGELTHPRGPRQASQSLAMPSKVQQQLKTILQRQRASAGTLAAVRAECADRCWPPRACDDSSTPTSLSSSRSCLAASSEMSADAARARLREASRRHSAVAALRGVGPPSPEGTAAHTPPAIPTGHAGNRLSEPSLGSAKTRRDKPASHAKRQDSEPREDAEIEFLAHLGGPPKPAAFHSPAVPRSRAGRCEPTRCAEEALAQSQDADQAATASSGLVSPARRQQASSQRCSQSQAPTVQLREMRSQAAPLGGQYSGISLPQTKKAPILRGERSARRASTVRVSPKDASPQALESENEIFFAIREPSPPTCRSPGWAVTHSALLATEDAVEASCFLKATVERAAHPDPREAMKHDDACPPPGKADIQRLPNASGAIGTSWHSSPAAVQEQIYPTCGPARLAGEQSYSSMLLRGAAVESVHCAGSTSSGRSPNVFFLAECVESGRAGLRGVEAPAETGVERHLRPAAGMSLRTSLSADQLGAARAAYPPAPSDCEGAPKQTRVFRLVRAFPTSESTGQEEQHASSAVGPPGSENTRGETLECSYASSSNCQSRHPPALEPGGSRGLSSPGTRRPKRDEARGRAEACGGQRLRSSGGGAEKAARRVGETDGRVWARESGLNSACDCAEKTQDSAVCSEADVVKELEKLQRLLGEHLAGDASSSMATIQQKIHCLCETLHHLQRSARLARATEAVEEAAPLAGESLAAESDGGIIQTPRCRELCDTRRTHVRHPCARLRPASGLVSASSTATEALPRFEKPSRALPTTGLRTAACAPDSPPNSAAADAVNCRKTVRAACGSQAQTVEFSGNTVARSGGLIRPKSAAWYARGASRRRSEQCSVTIASLARGGSRLDAVGSPAGLAETRWQDAPLHEGTRTPDRRGDDPLGGSPKTKQSPQAGSGDPAANLTRLVTSARHRRQLCTDAPLERGLRSRGLTSSLRAVDRWARQPSFAQRGSVSSAHSESRRQTRLLPQSRACPDVVQRPRCRAVACRDGGRLSDCDTGSVSPGIHQKTSMGQDSDAVESESFTESVKAGLANRSGFGTRSRAAAVEDTSQDACKLPPPVDFSAEQEASANPFTCCLADVRSVRDRPGESPSSAANAATQLKPLDGAAKAAVSLLLARTSWSRFASVRRFGRLKVRRRLRRTMKTWKNREDRPKSDENLPLADGLRPSALPRPSCPLGACEGQAFTEKNSPRPGSHSFGSLVTTLKHGWETALDTLAAHAASASTGATASASAFPAPEAVAWLALSEPRGRSPGRQSASSGASARVDPSGASPTLVRSSAAAAGTEPLPLPQTPPAESLAPCVTDRGPPASHQHSRVALLAASRGLGEAHHARGDCAVAAGGRNGSRLRQSRSTELKSTSRNSSAASACAVRGESQQRRELPARVAVPRLKRQWKATPRRRGATAAHRRLRLSDTLKRRKAASTASLLEPPGKSEVEGVSHSTEEGLPPAARHEAAPAHMPGSRMADRAVARALRRKASLSSFHPAGRDTAEAGEARKSLASAFSSADVSPSGTSKLPISETFQPQRPTTGELARGLPRHMAERADQRFARDKAKPGKVVQEAKRPSERPDGSLKQATHAPSCSDESDFDANELQTRNNGTRFLGLDGIDDGDSGVGEEGGAAGERHRSACEKAEAASGVRRPHLPPRGSPEATEPCAEPPDLESLFCPFEEFFGMPDLIPADWYGDFSERGAVQTPPAICVATPPAASSSSRVPSLLLSSEIADAVQTRGAAREPSHAQQLQTLQLQREHLERKHLEAVHALHARPASSQSAQAANEAGAASPCFKTPELEADCMRSSLWNFPEDLIDLISSVEDCSPSALSRLPRSAPLLPEASSVSSASSSSSSVASSASSPSGASSPSSSRASSSRSRDETASSSEDQTPPHTRRGRLGAPVGSDSEQRHSACKLAVEVGSESSSSDQASTNEDELPSRRRKRAPTRPRDCCGTWGEGKAAPASQITSSADSPTSRGEDSSTDSATEATDGSPEHAPQEVNAAGRSAGSALGGESNTAAAFVAPVACPSLAAEAMPRRNEALSSRPGRKAHRALNGERKLGMSRRASAGLRRRSRSQPPMPLRLPKRRSRAHHSRREEGLKHRLLSLESCCMSHDENMRHFARKMRLTDLNSKVACVELTKAKRAIPCQLRFASGNKEFFIRGDAERPQDIRALPFEGPLQKSPERVGDEAPWRDLRLGAVLTIESAVSSSLQRRGWIMNRLLDTHFFDLKWKISDTDDDYRCLRREQLFNHFQNNSVLTTKAGLSRSFRLLAVEERVRTDAFFPRCYDLSTLDDCADFLVDYSRCEAVTILLHYLRCCQASTREFQRVMREPAPDVAVRQSSVLLLWMAYHIVASWLHELDPDFFLDRLDPLGDKRRHDPQRLEVFATHAWSFRAHPGDCRRSWHALAKCSEGWTEAAGIRREAGCGGGRRTPPRGARTQGADAVEVRGSHTYSRAPYAAQIIAVLREVQKRWPLWRAERGDVDLEDLQASEKKAANAETEPNGPPHEPRWSHHNVWIMKPSSNSRASGIYCLNNPWDILKSGRGLSDRLVQKYVERPLLLFAGRKFDMRQWVFIRSFSPLKVYAFTDLYLRLCTEAYDLRDLPNRFRHISNWNLNRLNSDAQGLASRAQATAGDSEESYLSSPSTAISSGCIKPLADLELALDRQTGTLDFWDRQVKPQIRNLILQTARAARPSVVSRPNCFELYGFDILLDAEYRPWLIEVNLSPACAAIVPWHKQMVSSMTHQLLQLLLDEPRPPTQAPSSCAQPRSRPYWELLFDESVAPADAVRTFPPIEPAQPGAPPSAEARNPFLQFYSQHFSAASLSKRRASCPRTSTHLGAPSCSTERPSGPCGVAKGTRGPSASGKMPLWDKLLVIGQRLDRQQAWEVDTRVRVCEAARRIAVWWRRTAWRRRAARRLKVKLHDDIELDVCFAT